MSVTLSKKGIDASFTPLLFLESENHMHCMHSFLKNNKYKAKVANKLCVSGWNFNNFSKTSTLIFLCTPGKNRLFLKGDNSPLIRHNFYIDP